MKIIKGDLIKLAKESRFNVIAHGCNCISKQKSGIAAQMAKHFGTDKFPKEIYWEDQYVNKLGCIDAKTINGTIIINCYTQYLPGKAGPGYTIPLDYDALRMCMRKINYIYEGLDIGLPKIGCGLAGGDWNKVKEIIDEELSSMNVTIVEYEKS